MVIVFCVALSIIFQAAMDQNTIFSPGLGSFSQPLFIHIIPIIAFWSYTSINFLSLSFVSAVWFSGFGHSDFNFEDVWATVVFSVIFTYSVF